MVPVERQQPPKHYHLVRHSWRSFSKGHVRCRLRHTGCTVYRSSFWFALQFNADSTSTATSLAVIVVLTAIFGRLMTSAKATQMTTVIPGSGQGRRLAVFAAFDSCGFDVYRPELANVSIMAAVAAAKMYAAANGSSGGQVDVDVFDSCDAAGAIIRINNETANGVRYRAIAGPGVNRLCDFTAYIYQQINDSSLITWSCYFDIVSTSNIGNTSPSNTDTGNSVDALMYYFRWKHAVLVVEINNVECVGLAASIMSTFGSTESVAAGLVPLLVDSYAGIVNPSSVDEATSKLSRAFQTSTARAVIMVVSDSTVPTVLLAAHRLGLTAGQKAFIHVDTTRSLNVNSQLQMAVSWLPSPGTTAATSTVATTSSTTTNSSNVPPSTSSSLNDAALRLAAQSVLIVKAQSVSLVNAAPSDAYKFDAIDEYLFNAVSLAYQITTSTRKNVTRTDVQFKTISGSTLTTDSSGLNVPLYYSVWDLNPNDGYFYSVAETSSALSWIYLPSTLQGRQFWWLNDQVPAPYGDCEFISCRTDITGIVVPSLIAVAVAIVIVSVGSYCIWRRLKLRDLARGPHKLLLGIEDVVFVRTSIAANAASRSSLLSKSTSQDRRSSTNHRRFSVLQSSSDLRQQAAGSSTKSAAAISADDAFKDLAAATPPNSPTLGRYNGDLVFVKRLTIKGFEIRNKVQVYMKQMRELRHENVNPFVGCYVDPVRPALVYEYCQRRSLERMRCGLHQYNVNQRATFQEVIHNEDIKLDWEFKLSLLTDLVAGMRYIHFSQLKVHGNLKSSNCVIDSRWVLKITDFGVKAIYDSYQSRITSKNSKDLMWTAPELLRNDRLFDTGSQKADVYSFSIVMQEVILRSPPFGMLDKSCDEIIQKVRRPPPLCRPSVSPGAAPPEYIQMMKQCWAESPEVRPDFDAIYSRFKELNKGKKVNIVDTMFKMLEKYSNDLEEIVRVRTLALEEERKKTENLLSQMLPATVAQSLLTGKSVDPETYDEVTIYFSDIVGFTTISAMSTPMQVVTLLNDLYTVFDETIDDYDVYKVETIGDAYMVCSGLPLRNGNRHAGEIGTMALDILSKCGEFRIRHMPDLPLRIRIGLHTGSCVAGVVGLRMPRYCLFGDTVNTASRMESTGSAFRIHVSGQTKEKMDSLGGYILQYRGEVELKGKGMHKTYWLVGKEGFTKPLPEPPAQVGENNHGLGAYIIPSSTSSSSSPTAPKGTPGGGSKTNGNALFGQVDDVGSH